MAILVQYCLRQETIEQYETMHDEVTRDTIPAEFDRFDTVWATSISSLGSVFNPQIRSTELSGCYRYFVLLYDFVYKTCKRHRLSTTLCSCTDIPHSSFSLIIHVTPLPFISVLSAVTPFMKIPGTPQALLGAMIGT